MLRLAKGTTVLPSTKTEHRGRVTVHRPTMRRVDVDDVGSVRVGPAVWLGSVVERKRTRAVKAARATHLAVLQAA